MYTSQRFPPSLQYVATLPCEIKNPKMLLTLTAPQQSVDVFLWTLLRTWFNILDRLSQNCLHWLTFWSLSDDVSNEQLNLIQLIVASWRFLHHDFLRTVFVLSRLYFICCPHIEIKSLVLYFCCRLHKISH